MSTPKYILTLIDNIILTTGMVLYLLFTTWTVYVASIIFFGYTSAVLLAITSFLISIRCSIVLFKKINNNLS